MAEEPKCGILLDEAYEMCARGEVSLMPIISNPGNPSGHTRYGGDPGADAEPRRGWVRREARIVSFSHFPYCRMIYGRLF